MSLQDGDVIRFEYKLYVDGDKTPTETNIEAVAKEAGLWHEERHYHPMTVTLGGRQIIPGLEARIVKDGKHGAKMSVDLTAEEAYGPRDVARVKSIPVAEFKKQKVQPQVGMILNYQEQRAVVTRVGGGRVRLDMNHELAGKPLRYELTITEVLTDPVAKLDAVLEDLFHSHGDHKVTMTDAGVDLELPDAAKFSKDWPMQKFRVLTMVRQALGMDKEIRLIETYPAMKAEAAGEEE